MSYFRELPNLQYQSFLSDKKSVYDYVLVKNLFRRVKLRDDLQNVFTIFDKYQIPDGSRPDLVAEELYGSSQYDWVVLITAGITRVRDQWPLSDRQVYDYAEELYGENLNAIHHYETIEVRDSNDKLILPAGKVVDSDFSFVYLDKQINYSNSLNRISYTRTCAENTNINSTIIKVNVSNQGNLNIGDELFINQKYIQIVSVTNGTTDIVALSSPIPKNISKGDNLTFKYNNTILITTNPVVGISNYEYEVRKNNKKRTIYVLKPVYLQQVLNDTRKAMIYDNSSQYVSDKIIKTENTRRITS